MGFIDQWVDFTSEYETPTSFWWWSGISIVSAICRDRLYLEQGIRKTYMNMYILLLAQSANFRKSGPFSGVEELLRHKDLVPTKVFRGRSSIQAVAEELSRDYNDKLAGNQKVSGGSGIVLAEELSAFFVQDQQVIGLLTDLYDPRREYQYKLRNASFTIKNLCFSMLAASNEKMLEGMFQSEAVYGGLLSRTCVVKPDEVRKPNALLHSNAADFNGLVKTLSHITKLHGGVKFSPEASEYYTFWYEKHYAALIKNSDSTGVMGRMHTHLLKLSMVLAVSNCRMTVEVKDVELALTQLKKILPNYEIFVVRGGRSPQAQIAAILAQALKNAENGVLSRQDFMLENWTTTSTEEVDRIIATFRDAGMIKVETDLYKGEIWKVTPKGQAAFQKLK